VPCLLPTLSEDIAFELGTLIINRRNLRNEKPDMTFVNPDNNNDYHKKDKKDEFEIVNKKLPMGRKRSDEGKVKVQVAPDQEAKYLH